MDLPSKFGEGIRVGARELETRVAEANVDVEGFLEGKRLRVFKYWDSPSRMKKGDHKLSELAHTPKKKITFILPEVSYAGVAKVGLLQANLLKAYYNHDVEVISLIKEGQKFEELLDNVRITYALPIAVLSRSFYHISTRFMKVRSDLMLAHNIPATIVANRMFRKNRVSYVAYVHDATYNRIPGSFPSFGYNRIKESLSNATIVFTNSLKTLQELRKQYRVDGFPLHPGCFPAEQINDRRGDYFLFVHFISPRRSFDFLARLLEKEDFNLIIAGGRRWGWRGVFHSFQKFGNRVRFIFEPTEAELSMLYQHAKGLIFPEVENFGLPPLEAGAYGCPSIIAEGSGVLEILEKGKEVLTCREGEIEEFSKAIRILKEDAEYAKELGKRAWETAKRHSWRAHVTGLAQNIATL